MLPGAPALTATVTLSHDPGTTLEGWFVSPDGQTLGQQAAQTSAAGDVTLELVRVRPAPGRWRLLLTTERPVGGTTTAASFSGHISFAPYTVSAAGVPNNPRQTLPAGTPVTAQVTLTNPGPNTLLVFVDPRLVTRTNASLVPFRPATNLTMPLTSGVSLAPRFMVPTETDALFASATGSAPLTFDWGFFDPSLRAYSTGTTAAGWYFAREVTPGFWGLRPTLIGPFTDDPRGRRALGSSLIPVSSTLRSAPRPAIRSCRRCSQAHPPFACSRSRRTALPPSR